ncbi:MAG: PQQ-binding-like beta-propeller repeat protein, partial [Candidatus Kapabacteria bacterium]|nr:PQQ-binding-like beta-propeller repeat protein [Candidatus Kapabacteria bacterium]
MILLCAFAAQFVMAQVPQGALWSINVDADAQPIVMAHDRFIVNTKKSAQCYGASDGKLRWELPLEGIDRSTFTSYAEQNGNLVIMQYGDMLVQINVETGKETWRSTVNSELLRKGSKCYRVLSEQRRTIVFTKDMKADIYDDVLGKRIGSIPCKPNIGMIRRENDWVHTPSKENTVVLIDEAGV